MSTEYRLGVLLERIQRLLVENARRTPESCKYSRKARLLRKDSELTHFIRGDWGIARIFVAFVVNPLVKPTTRSLRSNVQKDVLVLYMWIYFLFKAPFQRN